MRLKSKIVIIASTLAATAFCVVLALNFAIADKRVERKIETLYTVANPQFMRTMGVMLGPVLLPGNRAEVLLNGDDILPSMLAAIRGAQKTISFETYIYWSGKVGQDFADALSERARAGVKVHVLVDWVGSSKMKDEYIDEMTKAGVEIRRYNKPHWYTMGRFNNRTHRKLLVVDGRIGFTGGVGIADEWSGHAQDPAHWRDSHFRIEGPVVAQMQTAFLDNWIEVTGEVLHGDAYFPPLAPTGVHYAQVFTSSPGGGSENMQMMYLLSIAAAANTIRLSASYFVPDEVALAMFGAALKRGVKVQIILPGPHMDAAVVRQASRSTWGALLRAGAEIYEYQPTMYHCKVMVVDDLWTSVGSTNFDNRSFSINDEANLNIYNGEFARQQTRVFNDDLKNSRRITLAEWENRAWTEKLWEHTLGLFNPQL